LILQNCKDKVCEYLDKISPELLKISDYLFQNPQIGFEEKLAHDYLTDYLEGKGFSVTRQAFGLETAFKAEMGRPEDPAIIVCCEYDALPDLGHACGHNIIASISVGAAVGVAPWAEEQGGRVVILGTPAEEGGGGKIVMAERGAFKDSLAALMIHPANLELTRMTTLANIQIYITYTGKTAHAAAAPWEGRNALDAAVLGYMNVAALRQHIARDERVHGIFLKGGDKPNIVPGETEMHYYLRSPSLKGLEALRDRVLDCFKAGAMASGCEMSYRFGDWIYREMKDNETILGWYKENAQRFGRKPEEPEPGKEVVGSTDMGNVSHLLPAIHPLIAVAPPEAPLHSKAFAEYASSKSGQRAVKEGAKILALTILDCWKNREFLKT